MNLDKMQKENDAVGVFKAGASFRATFMGMEVGLRIGIDSEDDEGGLIDLDSNPTEDGAFEVSGTTTPLGPGISGSLRINPFGVYLSEQAGVKLEEPSE